MIVEFEWTDFMGLIKKEITREALMDLINMLGTPVEEFDDDVIKIEVFPNRPDLLSASGMARAINGLLGKEVGYPMWNQLSNETTFPKPKNQSKLIRLFLSFSTVKGVTLSEVSIKDLMQLQEKLHISLGRNRKKFSIGVYDIDKIKFPIRYEEQKLDDILFTPLEGDRDLTGRQILEETEKGKLYAHLLPEDRAPVLLDAADRIISMPPIINSDFCKVTETSRNILIDSTGTAPGTDDIVAIVATSLADRGGKLQPIEPGPNFLPKRMKIDHDYIKRLLGLNLTNTKIEELLNKMRFGTIEEAMIPPYRIDITSQMDLAEDVAIAYGYDKFETHIPKMNLFGEPLPSQTFVSELRKILVGFGFLETKGFNLVSPLASAMVGGSHLKTLNSKSSEYSVLRPSILPSLYYLLLRNKDSEYPQKVFEIGSVFTPDQELRISGLVTHSEASFSEIKGLVDSIQSIMFSKKETSWTSGTHQMFLKGRTAISDEGVYGELEIELSRQLGMPIVGFELKLQRDL